MKGVVMKNISELIRKYSPEILIMPLMITEDEIKKLKEKTEKEKEKNHNETKVKE